MGYFGYTNVTKIPAGASHIKVTDKSRNYLGRTCPISVPVSPSPSQSTLVGATHGCRQGRAGGGCSVPFHAVPPLRCFSECCRFNELFNEHLGQFSRGCSCGFWEGLSWSRARTGILRPPSPLLSAVGSMSPAGTRTWGLGGSLHTRVWLGMKAKILQESRFLVSPDHSSPSPRCPPCSGRGLRWGPSHCPAQGSQGPCSAWASGTLPPTALMTSDGRYVLNGDWSIAWPGQYEVAGTHLQYTRTPDGTESLEAPGPTNEDLQVMVLLQEPNPGIEYEFWLPRGHPQPGHGNSSPLRHPQPRGAGTPPPQEPLGAPALPPQPQNSATEPPLRSPPGWAGVTAGRCGRCRTPKGRSQRIRHFCESDFVFQGRILARRLVGQETRYEVEVKTLYRHRFPLVRREYVWVPNACGCPPLREGGEYLLMARQHVNYERTLNRILLQDDGYARPWTPREDRLVREAARHCPQPRPP
ncbi:ADAMTS-like protein 5 isoform X3 [Strigops habroptila]|uniref:ADAMTS-like protein 5 isoform X3 n=1 Tax=Strigops habroptila TaxID=2489341 RepID=UPI0014026E74|nr:ADAMTS-like protein 5 isoform X3 [Strigops habroptila]